MPKQLLDIIFEDDALIIVNKPSGLLSIPDRYRPDLPNLHKMLQDKYGEAFIVHRLDRGTSGLICFAKTAEAHKALSKQFEDRTPVKKYHAIVQGIPHEEHGHIDAALSPKTTGGMKVDIKRGKPSQTDYTVLEKFARFSLIEAVILTGRTHQIRVHMRHIGHPLAVDQLYTNKKALFLSDFKRKSFNISKNEEERPLLSRMPLHAYSLSLDHPERKERIHFDAPYPKDIRATLQQLRKWSKK